MLQATYLGPALSSGSSLLNLKSIVPTSRSQYVSSSPIAGRTLREYANGNEELAWSGSRLVWSRNSEIFRQYSFHHVEQDVSYAVFAHFKLGDDERSSQPYGKQKQKQKERDDNNTFGPFHESHLASWGGPRPSTSDRRLGLERCLMVFLQTKAYIYFPTGEEIIVHLPFVVEKAWGLPTIDGRGGVLMQRRLEKREVRRMKRRDRSVLRGMEVDEPGSASVLDEYLDLEEEREGLARLWSLERPFEELKTVAEGNEPSIASSSTSIPAFTTLLFVSDQPYSIMVAYDLQSHQIVFYRRYRLRPTETTLNPPIAATPMRPGNIVNLPDPPRPTQARPSLHRNASSFASGPSGERRLSNRADPLDRTSRRAPRLSRGTAPEPTASSATGELHAALDPPPLGMTIASAPVKATRPRGQSNGSAMISEDKLQDKRRTSGASAFLRQGKNEAVSVARLAVKDVLEKDMRETTMMMGLEKEDKATQSDIVLERIGTWTPPSGFDPSTSSAFLSEDLSPNKTWLNIHSTAQLYIFDVTISVHSRVQIDPLRSVSCTKAVPITSTRQTVRDVLLLNEDGTIELLTSGGNVIPLAVPKHSPDLRDEVARRMASSMVMDEDETMVSQSERRIVDLVDSVHSDFTAVYEDGERIRFEANFLVRQSLTRQCMESLSFALSPQSFFNLKRELLMRLNGRDSSGETWNIFTTGLRSMLGLQIEAGSLPSREALLTQSTSENNVTARRLTALLRKRKIADHQRREVLPLTGERLAKTDAPLALFALHLVAQDCRLSCSRRRDVKHLAPLLMEISNSIHRLDWWDYWKRLVPAAPGVDASNVTTVNDSTVLSRFDSPPDIVAYLSRRLATPLKPFPSPESLGQISEFGSPSPCRLTETICEVYHRLGAARRTDRGSVHASHASRAADCIKYMVAQGLKTDWLNDVAPGIVMPIYEMIRFSQANPAADWAPEVYDLIGRADWSVQIRGYGSIDHFHSVEAEEEMPTVRQIMSEISVTPTLNAASSTQPDVRFGSDRRVQEVERIMETGIVRTISVDDPKGASDQDIISYHQNVVNTLANRTLAVTVGQGIFEFGTKSTTMTDAWDIPLIELSVKILPANTVIKAQISAGVADWPCFHNGVSAALSIAPSCKGIDSSWIVFNRPQNLNPEHGGFLLGLGLTGHLRSLVTYHAFPYMEPRHDHTSCGLLLGLGCSFAGSEDLLITKVLSLHTHALLPLGSIELNASPLVQCSALLGLGLVHSGSGNLRIAEIALTEIGRRDLPGVESFTEYLESYAFSASMSFALVMLGRGGRSEVDRRLIAQLRRYIYGDAAQDKSNGLDTTVTASGATLALGLMYLKTGRRDIADTLEIPQSAFAVELVRPDLLLLRVLARSLIMWEDIQPSMDWIESHLPPFIRSTHQGHKKTSMMELATELAYFNIIAGACLAIGVKNAGTASELAHTNLMFFFGILTKAASGQSMTYEGKIRRNTARQCLNTVTLALAVVMSGTGELNVLRRLRISHGQEGAGVTYGTHMAMHMACGLLFLGRGHYTMGSSNLAIAAMCISFYPRFQSSPDHNKAYPQSFRHLWALAVEPRCLQAKDVDTKETVYLPVKLATGSRTQNLISPTLIAPFETITSVSIDSPRYWPLSYDLSNPAHHKILVKSQTMQIKRKAGFLDYNSDPKGNRSIFVRAGFMSGFELYYDLISPAAPATISPEETISLVNAHSGDPALVAAANLFISTVAPDESKSNSINVDSFMRHVIIECISNDKPQMIWVYLSLLLSLLGPVRIDDISQLTMLRHFYSPEIYEKHSVSPQSDKRSGWLRSTFISAASRLFMDVKVEEDVIVRYFDSEIWPHDGSGVVPAARTNEIEYGDRNSPVIGLGVYLARNNVSPIQLLKALRQSVTRSKGGGVDKEVIVYRAREVARAYGHAISAQFDEDQGEDGEGRVAREDRYWKSESLEDAVRIWMGDER